MEYFYILREAVLHHYCWFTCYIYNIHFSLIIKISKRERVRQYLSFWFRELKNDLLLYAYFSEKLKEDVTLNFTYYFEGFGLANMEEYKEVVKPLPAATMASNSTMVTVTLTATHVGHVAIGLSSSDKCPPPVQPCTPPHGQNCWHTLLKILPCPNFVAGGNNQAT